MRSALLALACIASCLFAYANPVEARGPGTGGRGNVGQNSARQPGGKEFHQGGFNGGPNSSEAKHLKPDGVPTFGPGKKGEPSLADLHPSLPGGLSGNGGSTSSINPAGAASSSGATSNTSAPNGAMPAAGKIALAHKLEEMLRKHRLAEALQMLEQAKQSGNPQLAAEAEQILQHLQNQRAQQNGAANSSPAIGQAGKNTNPHSNGGQSGGRMNISHAPASGHASGHAPR